LVSASLSVLVALVACDGERPRPSGNGGQRSDASVTADSGAAGDDAAAGGTDSNVTGGGGTDGSSTDAESALDAAADGGVVEPPDAGTSEVSYSYNFDELSSGQVTDLVLPGVRITGPAGIQVVHDSSPYFVDSRPNYIVSLPDYHDITFTLDGPSRDFTINVVAVGSSARAATAHLYLAGQPVATVDIIGAGTQYTPVPLDLSAHGLLDRVEITDVDDNLGVGFDDLSFIQLR
jgi:hypothetical protein